MHTNHCPESHIPLLSEPMHDKASKLEEQANITEPSREEKLP